MRRSSRGMVRPRFGLLASLGVLAGCGSTPASTAPAPVCSALDGASVGDGLWIATDYSSSQVGAFALGGALTATGGVDLGGDPALSLSRGRAFYLARDQDVVFELDPACGVPKSRFSVHQASHTGSSNPHGVAVASDGSLWVTLYDVPALLVLSSAGAPEKTIDLSGYDGDGNPNADSIAIVDTPAGEKAFVALERLDDKDSLKSEQPSWMLRVDVASRTVDTHVALVGRNPFAMVADGSALWLSDPGNFYDATETNAGIERFDTTTSTTALVLREPDLGGSVAEVAVNGGCGVAIVADPTASNATSLVTFDPVTGDVLAATARSPLATSGFDLQGLAWKAGVLLAGDRRRLSAGYPVHAFDAEAGCDLRERMPITLFLPRPPIAVR
jgi:streptogramin lyase